MKTPTSVIEGTLELNNEEIDFSAEVEYSIGNDGIGPCECWGYKFFDKGNFVCEEIILRKVFVDKSVTIDKDDLYAAVERYIQDNFDSLATDILEKNFEDKMDYPERD